MQRFKVGDKVSHYSADWGVGTVIEVRRPWWAFFGRTYLVDWRGLVSEHAYGLWPESADTVTAKDKGKAA